MVSGEQAAETSHTGQHTWLVLLYTLMLVCVINVLFGVDITGKIRVVKAWMIFMNYRTKLSLIW